MFRLMQYPNEPVGGNKETLEHASKIFDFKFKRRINQIEIVHCLLRLLMLWDTLSLP